VAQDEDFTSARRVDHLADPSDPTDPTDEKNGRLVGFVSS